MRRRFKNEIGSIRKKAEQALVEALVKYHYRRTERLTNKLRKLEQYKFRRNTVRNNIGILSRRLTRKRNHRLKRKLSTMINCVIHWKEVDPGDSVIHLSKDWAQTGFHSQSLSQFTSVTTTTTTTATLYSVLKEQYYKH